LEQRNLEPKEVKANGPESIRLNRMAILDPEGFARLNLGQVVGKVTQAELDSLSQSQARLIKEGTQGPTAKLNDNITSAINLYGGGKLKYNDRKTERNDERFMELHSSMRADLEAITGGKREPTEAESAAAFDRAVLKYAAKQGQSIGDALGTRGEIPNHIYVRIRSNLKAGGRAADGPDIVREYFKHKGKPGFW
jgi:hypothetical protein